MRFEHDYPETYPPERGYQISVASLQDELTKGARPTLLILLGTAALVLLIACANVANLAVARLMRRDREMAVRASLGAGRARLVGQALVEATLLSLVGAAVGLFIAYRGLDLLVAFIGAIKAMQQPVTIPATIEHTSMTAIALNRICRFSRA